MPDILKIVNHFALPGKPLSFEKMTRGHINLSWQVTASHLDNPRRYVLQKINRQVFPAPAIVMRNIKTIVNHCLQQRMSAKTILVTQDLNLVNTQSGHIFHQDDKGDYWRLYNFVEGARTFDAVQSAGHAFQAAAAFGEFPGRLQDLAPTSIQDVIVDFHNTPARFQQFTHSLRNNASDRARLCQPEIATAERYRVIADELLALERAGDVPRRIVHNDTKINNVMMDKRTGHAACVIDLDTVMAGLSLYDFGDLIRTASVLAAEDEQDFSIVRPDREVFTALARGYISTAGEFLTPGEVANLARSGRTITLETALRFLTDYLNGDQYFRVSHVQHNLQRARTQFALADAISNDMAAMQRIIDDEYAARSPRSDRELT